MMEFFFKVKQKECENERKIFKLLEFFRLYIKNII